jgi:Na+/H+-dicarboxylate symporter
VAAHAWPAPAWRTAAGILDPLGTLWLSALRMLVLPLLVSILLVAIGRGGSGLVGRLGARTLGWFLGFLAVAAVLAVLFGRLVLEAIPVPDAARVAFQAGGTEAGPPAAQPTVRDWIVSLMPSNLFAAAAREDLLALIVATVLFGLALRSVSLPGRTLLLDLAGAVSEWCLALAGLLLRVLPAAVFVLTFVSTARTGVSLASGLVYYIALLCVGLSLGILLLYPITAWLARMSVTRFAAGAWPVQVMAFSTRSSVACLPAMLDAARSRLRLPDAVSSFTLPLAVASFKMNVAISANLQLLFLLHVYGLSPNLLEVGLAVVALTVQSFITPGLPSGAIWTTTPVYLSLGIPLPGIVLANVVDTIPDLFKTTINVTADLSITSIVAHQTGPVPATE